MSPSGELEGAARGLTSKVNIRSSQLRQYWDDLLSGEQIQQWVFLGKKSKLPEEPGVYRWMFPAVDSGRHSAYIGETEDLRSRLAKYLNAGNKIGRASC